MKNSTSANKPAIMKHIPTDSAIEIEFGEH